MSCDKQQIVIYRTNSGMVVTAPTLPDKEVLQSIARVVAESYAAELIDRFWAYFVGRSVDLREEYEKYYAPEYATIPQFLYQKYAIAPRYIKTLEPLIARGDFVGLVKKTWGRDWQMESLLDYCETGLATLMKAVNASFAEVSDEN